MQGNGDGEMTKIESCEMLGHEGINNKLVKHWSNYRLRTDKSKFTLGQFETTHILNFFNLL